MSWGCPSWVEDALWKATPKVSRRALVQAIIDRSVRYTTERERLDEPGGPADLAARALFFTVADVPKILVPMAELQRAGLRPGGLQPRVLDVGAGCGAMTLGLLASDDDLRPSVVVVDRDGAALEVCRDAVGDRAALQLERRDVCNYEPSGQFDIILAGTVLNELPAEVRLRVATRWMAALAPDGVLIIVEPALRETSRALHALRDELVTAGRAHVLAPCTRRGTPCPALADERDWCHEDRPMRMTARTAQLVAATGLRAAGMKFSYLVLRQSAACGQGEPEQGRRLLRVVSGLLRNKGKAELFACGDDGRAQLRLLKRNRTSANRSFMDARRGDLVEVGADNDLGPEDGLKLLRLERR